MYKVLIEYQNGDQELKVIQEGSFSTVASLLWDERNDGGISNSIQIGGMVRVGQALQLDSAKLSAYQARKQAEQDSITQKTTDISNLKSRITQLATQADLTNADIKEAIFKLIKLKILKGEL